MKILITGAGSGIGYAAAHELKRLGHDVCPTVHTKDQCEKLLGEGFVSARMLDITNSEEVDEARKMNVDVLIHSAAVGETGPVSEIPLDRLQNLIDVNVMGSVRMVQAVVPQMVERKAGRIILLSSLAGRVVTPFLGPYNMTKFAVEALGDSLRLELAPHGIDVSLIEPGLIYTGFNERMAAKKYEWLRPSSVIAQYVDTLRRKEANLPKASSTPAPVVKAIVHAVTARRPKIRYIAPQSYSLPIKLLRLLPDRMKDQIIRTNFGL